MSKRFRKLLYVVGTLAALAAVATGVMSTPWFRRLLERRIVASLEDLTGGHVEIGKLRFRPVVFQVVFRDLVIHGSELAGEPPLFSAHTVVVGLNPAYLLRHRIHLRNLDWDNAQFHLRTKPDGSTNIPGPTVGLQAGKALDRLLDLSIGRVTLAHSSFFWNDQRFPLDLNASEVAILLRLSHGQRYAGSLASSAASIRFSRWSPPPLTLTSRFEFSRTDLAVTSLAWQAPGMSGQGSFTLHDFSNPEGYFSFQTNAETPTLAQTLRVPELRGGSLRVEGQGIYRYGEVSAQGRVQARQLQLLVSQFNPGRLDASADYSVEKGRIELSNLLVSGLGGTAQGRAEIAFSDSTPCVHLRTQFHGLHLATILRSLPAATLISRLHPSSSIDGTAEAVWTGNLENLKSEFNLLFRPPTTIPQGSLPVSGHARGTAHFARGLAFDTLEAQFRTPKSLLTLHGALAGSASRSAPASKLRVEGVTSDFEEWRPVVEILSGTTQPIPLLLKSPATFSGEVFGSVIRPQISGRFQVGESDYHGGKWDKLAANVVAAPDFIEISNSHLDHGTSVLNLEASARLQHWRLTPDSAVHLSVRAQRTPLEGLKAALGAEYPVSGYATGRLDLDGTASNLTGAGVVRVEDGKVGQEPFDSLATNIRVAQSVWTLKGIHLEKGHGRITGQISFEPAKRFFSGELRGTDFSLAEFRQSALAATRSTASRGLGGRASFDLRGEGTAENLQLHSTWTIQEMSVDGSPIGDLRGQLDGQGQHLRVQGEGSGPAGTLQFSGESRPGDDWPFELKGQYNNLRVDPWIRILLNGKFNATVTATGSLKLTGPLRRPEGLELASKVQTLEVSLPTLKWKNDQPIDLRYATGVLTTRRFRMHGPSTDLGVEGSMRFAEPPVLSLTAQGMADAALLSLLEPGLQATGGCELKLGVSGSPAHPVLNGTLDVQDVSLSYGDLPFRLSSLKGTIELEGERAVVRSLRGVSGGGAVTVNGFVTLTQTPRFELQANLDQVRVRYPADFITLLHGNLGLAGSPDRGQLQGELVVRQVLASENVNWLVRMIQAGGLYGEQTPGVPSLLASKIRLNVRVTSAPPVRLETRDLRLLADLDVRLQGTLANPVEVGTIHLLSGEAVFRGNRYKLIRGDLSLTNPLRTRAVLDLEAQTRVQRYDLTVDVSGPFDRLKFAYRSDPPLPTADILSLLALGYSRQDEEMSTVGEHTLPSVGASALLSEALSSQVTGRIQRLFGVSRIKIDPNVGAPGYGSGARVTVEQQVTRDFTLTYVTNTAASQYRIIQFELAISDSVSLIGARDQNGIFGLEVKFRQRFK